MSQTKRARNWAFTVSKPTDTQLIHFEQPSFESQVKWMVASLERGDLNEGLHIQGCISFKNAKTWGAVRKVLELKAGDELSEFHSSPAANVAYCRKGEQSHEEWTEDGIDGENYGLNVDILKELGSPPKYGEDKTSQWDDIRQAIENGWSDLQIIARWPQEGIRCQAHIAKYRLLWDRLHSEWRDVEVTYIFGATGTGKTRSVMEKYGYRNVFRVTDYPTKGNRENGAFDMYDGEEIVLFEEFRSSLKLEKMLNYLDGYPIELPCRYSNKMLKATKIFIVTNIPLNEQYRSFHDEYATVGKMNSWEAFNRRINHIIEAKEGHLLTVHDLPILAGEQPHKPDTI